MLDNGVSSVLLYENDWQDFCFRIAAAAALTAGVFRIFHN